MWPPTMKTGCGVGMCNAITGKVIFLCLCQWKCEGPLKENTVLNKRGSGKLKSSKMSQRSHGDMSGKGCKFTTQHLPQPSQRWIYTVTHTGRIPESLRAARRAFLPLLCPLCFKIKLFSGGNTHGRRHMIGNWTTERKKCNSHSIFAGCYICCDTAGMSLCFITTLWHRKWDTKLCALHFKHYGFLHQ